MNIYRDTLFSVWKTGNVTSGYKKSAGFLELRTVNNAGHLVPMDQGEACLNMVT
jgi:carboxypeptidase C (cathepsin A)